MKTTPIASLGKILTNAFTIALAVALAPGVYAQDPSPTCDELVWSAQVLAANPDIRESCLGVYERNNTLYARSEIELTRVRGNRITFRPLHRDGSKGRARSINVPSSWRADIQGRSYRAGELLPGQRLSVFIPEDRFALAVHNGDFADEEQWLAIEEAGEVTAMPSTASAHYNQLAAGLALLGLAVGLTLYRRRQGLRQSQP